MRIEKKMKIILLRIDPYPKAGHQSNTSKRENIVQGREIIVQIVANKNNNRGSKRRSEN